MNTTTAAIQAHVTAATIRTWCRAGVIAATKQAGRWIIDTASLAHRVAIGAMRTRKQATMTQPDHGCWNNDHPSIDLLNEAVNAGVAPLAIAEAVGPNTLKSGYHRLSNADQRRVRNLIDACLERTRLLDELEHLANCMGHDGAAKRRAAERKLTDHELTSTIFQARVYARTKGIDVRAAAQKAPRPATEAQIAYILDLLEGRRRTGDSSGFYSGPTTRDSIAKMTAAEASSYIDSLKGTY